MKENDYINSRNVAAINIAIEILKNIDEDDKNIEREISTARVRLMDAMNLILFKVNISD